MSITEKTFLLPCSLIMSMLKSRSPYQNTKQQKIKNKTKETDLQGRNVRKRQIFIPIRFAALSQVPQGKALEAAQQR